MSYTYQCERMLMQKNPLKVYDEIKQLLETPLDTSSPEVLTSQISQIESYSHTLVDILAEVENRAEDVQRILSEKKTSIVDKYKSEKNDVMNIKVDGELAGEIKSLNSLKIQANKIKSIIKLIDRRCSIGQSILSNITASIKAGINL